MAQSARSTRIVAKFSMVLIVMAAVFALYYLPRFQVSHFFVFQVRDLARAYRVARGTPIFFGPEATGGGNLPGGFFYWLLALPLAAGLDWRAVLNLSLLLFCAGALVVFRALARCADLPTAVTGSLLYVGSFGLEYAVRQNNNASFAPFFATVSAISLIQAYGIDDENRVKRWWTGAFFLGLTIQIHYSGIALLLAAVVMQAFAAQLGLSRLAARQFAGGLLAFLLALAPSFAGIMAQKFGWIPGREYLPAGQGSIATAVPSLVYQFLSGIGATPMGTMMLLVILLPAPPLALFVVRRLRPGAPGPGRESLRICRAAAFVTAVTFVPTAYALFRWIGFRYAPPYEASAAFFAAIVHREAMRSVYRRAYLGALSLFILLLACWLTLRGGNAMGAFLSGTYFQNCLMLVAATCALTWLTLPPRESKAVVMGLLLLVSLEFLRSPLVARLGMESGAIASVEIPVITPMLALSRYIRSATGWNYDTARGRIFYLNMQEEHSIEEIYRSVAEEVEPPDGKVPVPDGFLVGMGFEPGTRSFREWILSQKPLHPDLQRGLATGLVELGPVSSFGRVWVAPYRVRDPLRIPRQFQNTGYPYESSPGEERLGEAGARTLPDGSLLFTWQDCPDRGCLAGIRVRLFAEAGMVHGEAEVLGRGLSQPSEWTNPAATLAWKRPYVEVRCGKEAPARAVLAESVGTDPDLALMIRGMASSYSVFLSPYRRSFALPCRGKPTEISAGREFALVVTPLGNRPADPQPRTLRLP